MRECLPVHCWCLTGMLVRSKTSLMTSPTVLDPGMRSLSGFFPELGTEDEGEEEEEAAATEEEEVELESGSTVMCRVKVC